MNHPTPEVGDYVEFLDSDKARAYLVVEITANGARCIGPAYGGCIERTFPCDRLKVVGRLGGDDETR